MAAGSEAANSPPAQTSEWKIGERVMGVYEIRQLHWSDGMGLVYRAWHHHRKVEMAISRIKNLTPKDFDARSKWHNSC